ncbi:uncharacterized protein DNG_01171 [Cephalotrichum gorgonifer]|uniref:FAD-binding FR-type domain-containing protein n=1 Tax=Cephalotrichum gorgonifer TaxID=2041049 RepID=A0AAE8MQZ0_9PEZI|nr:uncharacterized protein DNG_01171 [Cephalotrichum gorgonifer]
MKEAYHVARPRLAALSLPGRNPRAISYLPRPGQGRIRTQAQALIRVQAQLRARTQSTLTGTNTNTNTGTPRPKRSRLLPKLILAGALSALAYYLLQPDKARTLNPTRFVPYTVTSKSPVSPTSFIISLRPQHPSPSLPYLTPAGSWWDFQWSVQVKQPEIQIQREYTPLPPPAADDDGSRPDELRFFVRKVEGGEVSSYLSRKAEGDTVELRLGERGFAFNYLDRREKSEVVCLAGGTGVATAMQVAHAVLGDPSRVHPDTRVRILWAVRRRSDVQSSPPPPPRGGTKSQGGTLEGDVDGATPITRELLAMKARYGKALEVRLAVDEEGTDFGPSDLRDALALPAKAGRGVRPRYSAELPPVIAAACAENAPSVPERLPPGAAPANLRRPVFVCGPEGFVERYAGRLVRDAAGGVWRTGGLLGDLNARYGNGEAWLVLGFP